MAKLPEGSAHVYHGGNVYGPGDELPSDLEHLADEDAESGPETAGGAGAGGGTREVNGVAVNPDFNAGDKATVPQFREELTRLQVEFAEGDRRDALKAKYEAAVSE